MCFIGFSCNVEENECAKKASFLCSMKDFLVKKRKENIEG